jgi:hypothetical protein
MRLSLVYPVSFTILSVHKELKHKVNRNLPPRKAEALRYTEKK